MQTWGRFFSDKGTVLLTGCSQPVKRTVPLSASHYEHKFWNKSDTGLELNLLQNYIFIPIDIFLTKLHNNGIENELDAWLTFLGNDEVDYIDRLISEYPQFKPMYEQLYDMCRNVEGVMQMFSEELKIMDRNTVKLMIDKYQEKVEKQNTTIEEQNSTIEEQNATIESQRKRIAELEAQLAKK